MSARIKGPARHTQTMAGYKDEDWLKHAYYEEERALADIADEFGVTIEAVRYYMDKYDLPRRRRGAREGEKNPAWKGGTKTLTCEQCGESFETSHYKATNGLATYCSNECKHIAFSKLYVGENNPQWGVRGEDNATYGRTGEKHPMYGVRGADNPNWAGGSAWRDTAEWTDARKAALDRDEYECQECGLSNQDHTEEYGYALHVHHITPVKDGGEKYNVDNLVSLCQSCHTDKHDSNFPDRIGGV